MYEWISRIGAALRLLAMLGVVIAALVVALNLTKKRLCREGAWLLALGLALSWTISLIHTIADLALAPVIGWEIVMWIGYGLDLVDLLCFGVIAAGLFMLRVPRRGAR